MVFQHAVQAGGRVGSKAVARYRVLSWARLWCVAVAVGMVAYIAACGYVYNLSRERHDLLKQRNALREEYLLLRSRCEALRSPLRIHKQAEAYGMVLLTEPQAVAGAPVVLARRN